MPRLVRSAIANHIITGDVLWVYEYDLTTEGETMESNGCKRLNHGQEHQICQNEESNACWLSFFMFVALFIMRAF